jgi:hypothetical protein
MEINRKAHNLKFARYLNTDKGHLNHNGSYDDDEGNSLLSMNMRAVAVVQDSIWWDRLTRQREFWQGATLCALH